jgi:hypothetical protein
MHSRGGGAGPRLLQQFHISLAILLRVKTWHYQPKVQKTLNAISLDFGLCHELAAMMSVLGLYYKESKFEQEVKDGASYETELRQGRLERVDCKGDTPTDESLW